MIPAYIILESSLDIIPVVDALVDCGYKQMMWDEYCYTLEEQWLAHIQQAKEVSNANSIILICWKTNENIIAINYK